jgi:hypothetical protein
MANPFRALLDGWRAFSDPGYDEARRKTPGAPAGAGLGPDGLPVSLPDPKGIADASVFVTTAGPGQRPKDTSRNARYVDFKAMDEGDIAAMLDDVVEAALTFDAGNVVSDALGTVGAFGFKLDGTKANAVRVIEDMCHYTGLRDRLPTLGRDLLKFGDGYLEHLDDGAGNILRVQTYYPDQIYVDADEKGNVNAYVQLDASSKVAAQWAVDEMVHFTWWPSDREPYSMKALLDDLRSDWTKLQQVEAGMVTGRVSRAYPRNVHYIDTTSQSQEDARKRIMNYIRAITRVQPKRTLDGINTVERQDLAPNEDIFVPTGMVQEPAPHGLKPKLNKIELLDPNLNGLAHIGDVEYLRRKMFSRVPADVVGIGQANVDLSNQHIAYARLIRRLQQRLEVGLRELFTRTLLLAGIAPDTLVITWPEITSGQNWKFVDAQYREAQREQLEIESGLFSRKDLLMERHGKSPTEADEILTRVEEEKARFAPPAPPQADPNAPNSRAAQAAAGDKAGNAKANPHPADGPDAQANRSAQVKAGNG